jgi:hypothetical protein
LILNGNELPCMYCVKLQGLLEPSWQFNQNGA